MTKKRLAYFISIFILLCAAIFATVIIYWKVYPYKTYTINNSPVPVYPPVAKSEDYLIVHTEFCRQPGYYQVKRQLVSGVIQIDLPDQEGTITKTECGEEDLVVKLPKVTNLGLYHIRYETTVQVNPIRSISSSFDTQDFSLTR